MLPAAHRLRHSAEFSAVMRRGRRYGSELVVVHVLPPAATPVPTSTPAATRFGLVVGKAVGNSVVRHRISRRLRAALADRIDAFPVGSDVVVRALPDAAHAPSARLAAGIDRAATRLVGTPRSAAASPPAAAVRLGATAGPGAAVAMAPPSGSRT